MASLTISPEGDIEYGTFVDDAGDMFVRIELADVDQADSVTLVFRLPHFVAFADHAQMVAEAMMQGDTP